MVGAAGAPSSPSWDPNLGFSFTSRVWYSPNLARSVPRAVSSISPAQEKKSQSLLLPSLLLLLPLLLLLSVLLLLLLLLLLEELCS